MQNDPEAQEIMTEIVEINSKLAKLRARNIELEKEAASKDLIAAIEQRDALSKRGKFFIFNVFFWGFFSQKRFINLYFRHDTCKAIGPKIVY